MSYKQTSPIIVAEGGTGATTLTDHGVLLGSGTGAVTVTAVGTTGQVLTGVTGADPAWAAPAASSISITGDTGGAQTGDAFTFNGGTTGLSFGGAADVFTTTFAGITANGGTISLATDATTSTINVGTGAGVKTTALGSTNSTSTTTIQSGSGVLNVTSTGGALTVNSGTGALGISTDASATTVSLATGGAAKAVTLGSTNTTSSLALRYGTADFTLASATGTVMNALDTGEITYPLQPAFLAYNSSTDTNQTGNGTFVTIDLDTVVFDQGGDFSSDTFTAPVTAKYRMEGAYRAQSLTALATNGTIQIITSNATYRVMGVSPGAARNANNQYGFVISVLADMDLGDTAILQGFVDGMGADTIGIAGGSAPIVTYFSGKLEC